MRLPSFLVASAVSLAPSLALAQAAPSTAAPPAKTVRLHVDGPRFTKVLGRPIAGGEWTHVCSAPCDTPVPLDWMYQMRSSGMMTSRTFQLAPGEGDVANVHLHPAYTAWLDAGIVAAGAGVASEVLGVPWLVLQSLGCGFETNDCSRRIGSDLGVLTAVSAGLIALGVIAIATNHETTVTQNEATPAETPSEPVWHSTERRDVQPLSATIGAPLVTLRF
jgi:hypothetical protein